jgi:hypothetical protein
MSDPARWSHTRLGLYDTCPHAYELAYLRGEPQVATEPLDRGAQIHEAIERYALHCWSGGRKPMKTDFEAGRTIAAGYPDVEEDVRRFVEGTVWEWGALIANEGRPVEVDYSAALPNGDLYRGRIDLLQRYDDADNDPFSDNETGDLWVVTDWKSGVGAFSREKPPEQLLSYAWLVQQNHREATSFELRIDCVGWQRSPDPWRVSGDLSWVADRIVARIDRIRQTERFAPRPGFNCANCLHVHACDFRETATVQAFAMGDVAEKAQALAFLDAQVSAAKRALRKHVDKSGPVVWDRNAWAVMPKESTVPASVREVCEAMEKAGIDYWPYVGMTATQLSKAQDANPELVPMLRKLVETKVRNEFEIIKLPEAEEANDAEPTADAAA